MHIKIEYPSQKFISAADLPEGTVFQNDEGRLGVKLNDGAMFTYEKGLVDGADVYAYSQDECKKDNNLGEIIPCPNLRCKIVFEQIGKEDEEE